MAGRLLRSGTISSTFWHDQPADETYVIESVQDVEDIVDMNKAQYANVRRGEKYASETHNHVARIPMVIYMELVRKGMFNERGEGKKDAFEKWLADPDNRHFRTRPGYP